MKEKVECLYSKDIVSAYKNLLDLEMITIDSSELYSYFNILLDMIKEKSVIRVRAYRLICYLAKWDKDNLINKNIYTILTCFDDLVGTNIRQYLSKTNYLLLYKPELTDIVIDKINSIDLTKYKESMQTLIKKDINELLNSNKQ